MGILFELPIRKMRTESLEAARDNSWQEFMRTITVLRKAQDAMDEAHRVFMDADKELERSRER